jgi:hypothetical protein
LYFKFDLGAKQSKRKAACAVKISGKFLSLKSISPQHHSEGSVLKNVGLEAQLTT